MKINEVEQQVNITKKNIRFYEQQGLLNPRRNTENGYRDYSKEDVDELKKAQDIDVLTGMKLINQRSFYLSDEETFRTILVFEKVSDPTVSLPRRVGMAQKKPLIGA